MVDIRNPVGKGVCWISRLKGELVEESVASELLATNLSSLFLSSLISSCIGENVGTSFFFDDADVLLASILAHKFSSVFWLIRSNTLCNDFCVLVVRTFFYNLCGATNLGGRFDTIPL